MVCPSCGKYVAGAKALCKYCGGVLPYGVTPLSETHPAAGDGITTGAPDEMKWPRRAATACLLLGWFSLVALPVVFAFFVIEPYRPWEHGVLMAVRDTIVGVLAMSAILAGILALVLGGLAKVLFRRTEGTPFGADRTRHGMILGAIGVGSWILLIASILVLGMYAILAGILALVLGGLAKVFFRRIEGTPFGADRTRRGMILGASGVGIWILLIIVTINLHRARIGGGGSPVGGLRTINTAATTYASQYGHGFPLRLSYLGCDPSKTNDQAAGLIDEILASGKKSGYRFYYVAGPVDSQGMITSYTVYVDPINPKVGDMHYFTDQTRVIRQQSKRQANVNSPPIFQNY
jgi:hypothetical protein